MFGSFEPKAPRNSMEVFLQIIEVIDTDEANTIRDIMISVEIFGKKMRDEGEMTEEIDKTLSDLSNAMSKNLISLVIRESQDRPDLIPKLIPLVGGEWLG